MNDQDQNSIYLPIIIGDEHIVKADMELYPPLKALFDELDALEDAGSVPFSDKMREVQALMREYKPTFEREVLEYYVPMIEVIAPHLLRYLSFRIEQLPIIYERLVDGQLQILRLRVEGEG